MDPTQQIQEMQNQINSLQEQLSLASQAYQNLASSSGNLRPGKPDKFTGTNVRSWIKNIDNVLDAQMTLHNDEQKIKYAVSYMSGEGLQWWELKTIGGQTVTSYEQFKNEILKHFEPVNRELNACRMLNAIKQMGKLSTVRAYNHEFSKWLLQVPTMSTAEQLFHYSQGLKNRTRVEVERNNFGFGSTGGHSNGPTPMEIGNMNFRKNNRLSYAEKRRCIENSLCFICKKPNCYARKHRNNGGYNNKDKQVWFKEGGDKPKN